MSFEAKRSRHVAVAASIVAIGSVVAMRSCQQPTKPQQPDLAYHQTFIGWRVRHPGDRGLGFDHTSVGPAIAQCLHQNTRRRNAPPQQLSLAEQMVDGVAHERYRAIAISMPSPLTRHVHVDER